MAPDLGAEATDDPPRYFFVHIMKTGGASFRSQIRGNFAPAEVYPDAYQDRDLVKAYLDITYLLGLPAERTNAVRVFSGHFPYYVTEVLSPDLVTLSILRDPVRRTISYLQHSQKYMERHAGQSLEQIYDDTWANEAMMRNLQTKVFAMTAEDGRTCITDLIDLDEDRMALARQNLAKVDVLGLHEHYEEFMDEVSLRLGWNRRPMEKLLASDPPDISDTLVSRIVEDNAVDIAFYEYAVELYNDRKRRG